MAIKRKALGRGLNALLPAASASAGDKKFLDVAIDSIVSNKHQPRSTYHPERLNELAQSIKSNGVVQPIIVRKAGSQYQLIAGERRWRAAKIAGLKTIPAVIRDVSEYKTLEMALIENIQREDLNPIEEATAYSALIHEFQLTQDEVAHRVGKDRSSIANYLRLLKLPQELKDQIQNQELSMGHARALIGLEKAKDQIEVAKKILSENLNVRQTENLIRNWKTGRTTVHKGSSDVRVDPNVRAAEQKLQERLGTQVVIRSSDDGKGRIEIHFHNTDDLIRIFDLIAGEQK
jgi:ParB family transcriptional regulator, chromosome partitioning protein